MGCSNTSKANPNTIKKNPQTSTNPQSSPANPNPSNPGPTNPNSAAKPNATSNPSPVVETKTIPPQVLTGVHALYDLGIPTSKTAWGQTFEATKVDSKEKRMIRSIRKSIISDMDKLKKELELLKGLNHPNITKVYELYDDPKDEYIYVISQLLKGDELLDRLVKEKNIELMTIKKYIVSIVEAVAYIHKAGLVHRRLTPSNIILDTLTGKDVLMVSNFSMAKFVKNEVTYNDFNGSPIFYAPEVHKSGNYNNKSDIWSIGMISFLILTGEIPYQLTKQSNVPQVVMQTQITAEMLSAYKSLSKEAVDFISKCLNMDEEFRLSAPDLAKHKFLDLKGKEKEKLEYAEGMKDFHKSTKIEKELFRFIYYNSEMKKCDLKMKEFFKQVDATKDGKITKIEFLEIMKNKDFGVPMSLAELSIAFDEADRDKSCNLSYSEFATLFFDKQKSLSVANIKKAFAELDKDDNYYLTRDDFAGMKGIEQVIAQVDKSKDGKITLEELIAFVTKA